MIKDICIAYTTNAEYRQCLRDVFSMNPVVPQIDDLDDETRDEMMYEADSVSRGLDEIYAITKDEPTFRKLYEIAAGQMMSPDPDIGLAVLCSYDYFAQFYTCVVDYVLGKPSLNANCELLRKQIS